MNIAQRRGFTIIEILVVLVVVSVLIALGTFAIRDWNERTVRSQVQSDLQQAALEIKNQRNFTGSNPVNQSAFNTLFTPSRDNTLTYSRRGDGSYCLRAQSSRVTTVRMNIDSRISETPREGTCS